jgi:hypothetical protein
MAGDSAGSANAAIRDVSQSDPDPIQDCSDIVHISVFFDGTGNNNEADVQAKKWSNVARIFRAAQILPKRGKPIHAIYISGVGTKFNGDAANWLDEAGVWIEDGALGLGAGAGGDRRLHSGEERLNDRLRTVLLANAKRLGGEVAAYAKAGESESFADLNEALSAYRLIKMINISVCGFSRGAALARAFINRLVRECEPGDGGLLYQGYPLRISFMGLFDTVASFGMPSMNVQLPFSERNLVIPKEAERCVHYVAAHEVRFSFPVDLIRKDGVHKGDWLEVVYPGVHSDVGGGYPPLDQGIDNNLARIPMRDMMREALLSGVRIMSYEQLQASYATVFKERFECRPETEEAYRHYRAVAGEGKGKVEEEVKRHLQVFYSACGTMHRRGIEGPGDRQRAASKLKSLGRQGMAKEIELYRNAAAAAKLVRVGGANLEAYAQYVKPEQWQIDAWDMDAPDNVVKFVSTYIHDSKVDFLGNVEPFSYFRPRGIHESTVSVWRQASDWAGDQASAAKQGAIRAGNYAATKAKEAQEAATRTAIRARDAAAEKIDEAQQAAQRIIEAGVSWIKQTADDVGSSAKRLWDKFGDI